MTTMLDAITQAQIWQAVLEIAKKREMGIIVVSHEEKLSKDFVIESLIYEIAVIKTKPSKLLTL